MFMDRLDDPEALRELPGVGYLDQGRPRLNPPQKIADLDGLPRLPFHLIEDPEPYVIYNWVPQGGRCLPLETSRGCPQGCTFCEITSYFGKHYCSQSPERIIEDVRELKERFNIGGVRFFDPNFFLKMSRARALAERMIEGDLDVKWAADGTIMQFRNVDRETLALFHRAGLRFVSFGVESGSERVRRDLLRKRFSNQDCRGVVERFREAGLDFKFNIIIGLPGEQPIETRATVDFAMDILDRYPNAAIGGHMYSFMPLPGTPLTRIAEEKGYRPPEDLEGFADINYTASRNMPWLTARHRRMIHGISTMSYFLSAASDHTPFQGLKRELFRFFRRLYRFRMRRHWFMRTPDIDLWQRIFY
ncbi:MAG: B12-binding domain-containing radical SAM protein [Proteobacteria bacterium]|nr:B12-binding domain-containing radical SAM protein [Pseudomonadota bacterium]